MFFKFHVIRITDYGVIAEKPRVGNFGQMFPCTLQEELCVGSRMNDTIFDVHEELYHRANFGEDRTTRADCRCENMVFVCLLVTLRVLSTVRSSGA